MKPNILLVESYSEIDFLNLSSMIEDDMFLAHAKEKVNKVLSEENNLQHHK